MQRRGIMFGSSRKGDAGEIRAWMEFEVQREREIREKYGVGYGTQGLARTESRGLDRVKVRGEVQVRSGGEV